MENETIAQQLLDYAVYLEQREPNLYRIRAYRRAAEVVQTFPGSIAALAHAKGRRGLEELPGIGASLAETIDRFVHTGTFRVREEERGPVDPERLLSSVPGIGSLLARRLHEQFGIRSLEELERAVHDGRLAALGVAPRRLRGICAMLAERCRRQREPSPPVNEPSVADLLEVDQEYRTRLADGSLTVGLPHRSSANDEEYRPVLRAERPGWDCHAVFANTALAHRLGQTRDWVVITFHGPAGRGQRTIVTETQGRLRGRRVVRGREDECQGHYQTTLGDWSRTSA